MSTSSDNERTGGRPGDGGQGRATSDPAAFAERLLALHGQLAAELPEIDPGDLLAILHAMLRPLGSGRVFFLRRSSDGGHVF